MSAPDPALELFRQVLTFAAHRYPHLITPAGAHSGAWRDEWEDLLSSEEKRVPVQARLSPDLVARVERFRKRTASRAGMSVSKTAALESLLLLALDALDVVEGDPHLTADPGTVRELLDLTFEGLNAARLEKP